VILLLIRTIITREIDLWCHISFEKQFLERSWHRRAV